MEPSRDFDEYVAAKHARLVRALVMAGHHREDAEDALQHALAEAWRRWRRVSVMEYPDAYVVRSARNWLSKHRRGDLVPPSFGAELAVVGHEVDVSRAESMRGSLSRLSSDHRNVLILRFYLDFSERSTASALGVPIGTVKSRTARALVQLSEDPWIRTSERSEL